MTTTELGSQWIGAAHKRTNHVYHPSDAWTELERLAYAHGFRTGHRACDCHDTPPGVPPNAHPITAGSSTP